jgi:hypothetical protein
MFHFQITIARQVKYESSSTVSMKVDTGPPHNILTHNTTHTYTSARECMVQDFPHQKIKHLLDIS